MSLTPEELAAYERDGFVLLRGRIGAADLARWSAHFEALVTGDVPAPERLVVMQDVAYAKGDAVPPSPLHAINKILMVHPGAQPARPAFHTSALS